MEVSQKTEKTRLSEKGQDGKGIEISHLTIRLSISILLLRLIAIEIISAALLLIYRSEIFIAGGQFSQETLLSSFNVPLFITVIIIKILLILYVVLAWLNEYYEITPHFVMYKRGLLFVKEDRYTLQHIADIEIEQGIPGRLLNYGTIKLVDWAQNKDIFLYLIHNPYKYWRVLNSLIPEADEGKQVLREHLTEKEE